MNIIGIDPGGTTGVAFFQEDGFVRGVEVKRPETVGEIIEYNQPEIVVAEQFIVRSAKANCSDPLIVLGVVRYACHRAGSKLVHQNPSILRGASRLSDGLHSSEHVRSACAHVLYYLRKERG